MKFIKQYTDYILLILSVIIITGCASKDAYHFVEGDSKNCEGLHGSDDIPDKCSQSYYQEYSDYDLAFAEFTERGNAFNDIWIDNILQKIRKHAKDEGVIVVTFIHGWKHNAKENDPNLKDFKESLQSLAKMTYRRRLVGLYVGWRGASLNLPVLENVTFWERKAVAEEVGKGGVTRLLLQLDRIDRITPTNSSLENVMITIGHSFGGAIVVSAVTEVLAEKIIELEKDTPAIAKGFGDAIIVLNPAIEANQMLSLVETAIDRKYPQGQNPLFISISSDADSATHYAFPLGQTFGLLFSWHQLDLSRDYYRDRINKEKLKLKEEHLDSTTVGNFAPYLTHRLTVSSSEDIPIPRLRTCGQVPDECKAKGLTTLSGNPMIDQPDNYPLYFIKADKTVMTGHNDIFNLVVQSALFSVIDDIIRRTSDIGQSKDIECDKNRGDLPILNRSACFNKRFKFFYEAQANNVES